MDRRRTTRFFGGAQIAGGAAMAFMHGAQDGQKFMGVFMLGIFLAGGQDNVTSFRIPLWLMILCSLVMALGTSIGGYRIIKAVGMDMVKLENTRDLPRIWQAPHVFSFLPSPGFRSPPLIPKPRPLWAWAPHEGFPPSTGAW